MVSAVLAQLMLKLLEPLAVLSLAEPSTNVCFLVTAARRVNQLAALQVDPPFLKIFPKRVILQPSLRFLPKVVPRFHLSQDIILPVFLTVLSSENEQLLHSLDVRRALTPILHGD